MSDKFSIMLDAEEKWSLGVDSMQWIIYRVNTAKGKKVLQGQSFINSDRGTVNRCIREHGITLADEAKAKLAELPFTFAKFKEKFNPKSGKGRKGTDAPKVPIVSPALAKWNGYNAAMNGEAKNCLHRTGTALAKEWFMGYDAYLEGEAEPHKPTPRTKAKPVDESVAPIDMAWGDPSKINLPEHMLIKPSKSW